MTLLEGHEPKIICFCSLDRRADLPTLLRRTLSLCCARAKSGHAAAAPKLVMNSRRLIASPDIQSIVAMLE
jgi:hypothetical protein